MEVWRLTPMSNRYFAELKFSETAVNFRLSWGRGRSQKSCVICVWCMCEYTCVWVYVTVCICACECICGYVYECIHKCIYICICVSIYVCECVMYVYISDSVNVCACEYCMCMNVCKRECMMGDNLAQRLNEWVWESNWLTLIYWLHCSLIFCAAWYSQIPHL